MGMSSATLAPANMSGSFPIDALENEDSRITLRKLPNSANNYANSETGTGRSEQIDPLDRAAIHSKPMNVLDELESFWERDEASRGITQRGILAEHIMEKQAEDLKQGKGKGAFCM